MSEQPPARNVIEGQFPGIVENYTDYKDRLYGRQGEIDNAFNLMRKMLVGKNKTSELRELYQPLPDNYAYLGTTAIENGADVKDYSKRFTVDVSGWDINTTIHDDISDEDTTYDAEMAKVDKAISYILDLYLNIISTMSKANEIQNPQLMQRGDYAQEQMGIQTYRQMPQEGIFHRFLSKLGLVEPQWKQNYERSISLVSEIFDDIHNAKIRWQDYKAHHWTNRGNVLIFQPDNLVAMLFDELEALDDVRGKIMRLVDAGTRLLYLQNSAELAKLAQMIASSNQPAAGPTGQQRPPPT